MGRAARTGCFGLLILLVIGLAVVMISMRISQRLPQDSVLLLELGGEIEEVRPPGVFGRAQGVTVLHEVLDAIDTARNDSRIAGLVVKITPLATGRAKIQEIRNRLLEFRKSKKPSICYLHADAVDNAQYYLGSACEQVWVVPTAPFGITGMMAQSRFLRGTLDKLHINPDMYHIADYKTAMNMFTERKYTPPHREMAGWLLNSAYAQFLDDVSAARGMDRAQFEELVKAGPHPSQGALDAKLVDRIAYWDEVQQFFKDKHKEWRPVRLGRYLQEVENDGDEKIAVVHATGTIVVGQNDFSPLLGYIMGSDSVAEDLRRARQDKSVKAIILRVDSPGGSAVASEIIRREVELAAKEKPVVVSMSDVAGSGGYWISMSAHKILADPTTLTASIGVVYGKLNISGLTEMLGITHDHLVTSENATINWPMQNFTPAQREAVLREMRSIYDNFVAGVAAGRKMTPEAVDKIGQGRVFTGAQAKDLGLVDEVGDFDRALQVARELAKLAPDTTIWIDRYPREKTFFQTLMAQFEGGDSSVSSAMHELELAERVLNGAQMRMAPAVSFK
jgi:protease IV